MVYLVPFFVSLRLKAGVSLTFAQIFRFPILQEPVLPDLLWRFWKPVCGHGCSPECKRVICTSGITILLLNLVLGSSIDQKVRCLNLYFWCLFSTGVKCLSSFSFFVFFLHGYYWGCCCELCIQKFETFACSWLC